MKIPFTLDAWLKDKSQKVETWDGRSARIICWDAEMVEPQYKIVALVKCVKNYEVPYYFTESGAFWIEEAEIEDSSNDLFIVTPEPEMSEFELALRNAMSDTVALSEDREDYEVSEICDKQAKRYSTELITTAKQQLLQSGELMTQEHHEKLMETLREECKKDLPRWRSVEADKIYDGCVARYMDVNGDWNYCLSSGKLSDDCQYISIADLEKLPKEDESHE